MLWQQSRTPMGMTRRHFMKHAAGAGALLGSSLALGHSLQLHAQELKKNRKSAILLWMGGGPATIDLWDLKPGAATVDHSSRLALQAMCRSANTCR